VSTACGITSCISAVSLSSSHNILRPIRPHPAIVRALTRILCLLCRAQQSTVPKRWRGHWVASRPSQEYGVGRMSARSCNGPSSCSVLIVLSGPRVRQSTCRTWRVTKGAALGSHQPCARAVPRCGQHLPSSSIGAGSPCSFSGGRGSKLILSPATAEKCLFQSHLAIALDPSTPVN
jgi:hypothetical protein